MPEYCTCGARLPEDALFCHKCGKPQREDLIVREEPPPPPVLPPPVPVPQMPPPIGFHNGPAVRIAMVYGFLSILFLVVSGTLGAAAPFLMPVWLVAAGFLAVLAYRRRTGQRLSWLHGAHLGWICGIFGFAIIALVATVMMVALSDPAVVQAMRDMKPSPEQEERIKAMLDMIHNGPSQILVGLFQSFLLFTILPACGGALGVKLLDRD